MTYEELIESISIIVENDKIYKKDLTLIYKLEAVNHRKMNETLFYKSNPTTATFTHTDEYEVELGGVIVRFVKEKV